MKDFVKSRKHDWHEACYVPELADGEQLASVVGRFMELQGAHLSGGLVLRSFEPFVAGGEARVWWVDGVWRVVEVGDGQVSGLPAGSEAAGLFAALAGAEPRRPPPRLRSQQPQSAASPGAVSGSAPRRSTPREVSKAKPSRTQYSNPPSISLTR